MSTHASGWALLGKSQFLPIFCLSGQWSQCRKPPQQCNRNRKGWSVLTQHSRSVFQLANGLPPPIKTPHLGRFRRVKRRREGRGEAKCASNEEKVSLSRFLARWIVSFIHFENSLPFLPRCRCCEFSWPLLLLPRSQSLCGPIHSQNLSRSQ